MAGNDVTIPREVAQLIRKVFLPTNPKRARTYSPETMAAVLTFIKATEGAAVADAIKYERAPSLDKRIANGDDFAGDAWVRWTAVGQQP